MRCILVVIWLGIYYLLVFLRRWFIRTKFWYLKYTVIWLNVMKKTTTLHQLSTRYGTLRIMLLRDIICIHRLTDRKTYGCVQSDVEIAVELRGAAVGILVLGARGKRGEWRDVLLRDGSRECRPQKQTHQGYPPHDHGEARLRAPPTKQVMKVQSSRRKRFHCTHAHSV